MQMEYHKAERHAMKSRGAMARVVTLARHDLDARDGEDVVAGHREPLLQRAGANTSLLANRDIV